MRVYLSCPKCGSRSFEAATAAESLDRYGGATCLHCHTFLNAVEVKERMEEALAERARLKDEVAAEFEQAEKMPASFRSGRYQPDPDLGIGPEGEISAVWKPPNPEDEFN